jgi:hypothetical protein
MERKDCILHTRDVGLIRTASKVRDRAVRATALASAALASVTTRGLSLGHRLAHQLEGALLGDESERTEVFDGLLARGVLLARNDATVMLHQIFLGKAARGVFRGSVENLGFGADSWNV